jgi:hypothetical protein
MKCARTADLGPPNAFTCGRAPQATDRCNARFDSSPHLRLVHERHAPPVGSLSSFALSPSPRTRYR